MNDFINLLEKLVSFNSIFPDEKLISDFLYKYLLQLNFNVEKQYISENRYNILAEKGNSAQSFLLYAHTDTVPVYGQWLDNPFKLRLEGDKAIGLGSADMKSGIVAILKAIENFEPKNYKLKVAFGVDEENYSEGAFKIAQSEWVKDIKGVLVPESSLPANKSVNAGSTVTLGRKGRAVYTIKVYGKSAHGVEPEKGINAIEESAKIVIALQDFKDNDLNISDKNEHNSYFVRRLEAKTNSLSIPDYAELELDCHIVYPDNSIKLIERLKNFIQSLYDKGYLKKSFEISFSPRPTPFLEPFEYDKNDNFVQLVSKSVKDVYSNCYYNYGQSVADENVFGSLGIPTLTLGPLADNHHSAEEWVSIDSIVKLSEIYRRTLEYLSE